MQPEISIIVVSWNAKNYVNECLVSLTRQALSVPAEIIVVDNASTDGTPEMVKEGFAQVTLIHNPENLGFAKANNIGIQVAKGKYICLINSDVNVPPDCLAKIYDFMEGHPTVGMLGPQMLVPGGVVARSYMRFPSVWNCLCNALSLDRMGKRSAVFGGVLMTEFDGAKTSEVDVLNGWFLVVRRQALESVGLLDETFFMYGEDIDWSHRFHRAGWRRVYFADARALHYGGASSKIAPTRFYIQMQKANFQYWKKYRGWPGVTGYWFTILIHHLVRACVYSALYLCRGGEQSDASLKAKRSAACVAWLVGLRSA